MTPQHRPRHVVGRVLPRWLLPVAVVWGTSYPAADAPPQPPTPRAPAALIDPASAAGLTLLPEVLARVGDWPITRDLVWPTISARVNRILASDGSIPTPRLRFMLRPVVNDIIDEELLGPKAEAAGFPPNLERARLHLETLSRDPAQRAGLERLLQDVNLTTEQYIAKLALRTAIADWVRRTFVDPQEATAQEVAASYETRQKELTIPVSIWLERIVVNAAGDQEARGKAHTAAVAARARVAAGQSFAAVVPSVTEGSAPPPAAGAFSQARVQESQLPPPVLSALHSLEAGEISPVLELPNAFVLLRWRDRHASRQPSLNQVAAGLELNLKENKGHERFAAYLEALKQEAGLVFYLPLDPPTSRSEPPASQGSLLLP